MLNIMKWIRIDEKLPEEGQKVFYYFEVFKQVYDGFYTKDKEMGFNVFHGDHGFLGDDVTYWMPRNDGDQEPNPPSEEERRKCLYHPLE